MIKIITQNTRGVKKKHFRTAYIVSETDPDLICLQETLLKDGTILPPIRGYKYFAKGRSTNNGGGVAIYYKRGLNIEKNKEIIGLDDSQPIEYIGISLKSGGKVTNVYSIYIPPHARKMSVEALNLFDIDNSIMCGDYNGHNEDWSEIRENTAGKWIQLLKVTRKARILHLANKSSIIRLNKKISNPDLIIIGRYVEANNTSLTRLRATSSDHYQLLMTTNQRKITTF